MGAARVRLACPDAAAGIPRPLIFPVSDWKKSERAGMHAERKARHSLNVLACSPLPAWQTKASGCAADE